MFGLKLRAVGPEPVKIALCAVKQRWLLGSPDRL
jgi:hypothetical protein